VIKGEYTAKSYDEARKKESDLDAFMKRNKYNVFSKVIVSQNIENGMVYLIQSSGLGGLEPNTIVLSWPNQFENDELKSSRFINLIKHAHAFGHLLTILKPQKNFDNDTKHAGTIDIWSFNFEKGMLLLIAQILTKNSHWKRCKVRLFIITSLPLAESETMKRVAREYLSRYRLLQDQGNIFIEVVHVEAPLIE
jgi:potassium/chloride transporter 4/5/6